MQRGLLRILLLIVAAGFVLNALDAAEADSWGTIKGQVVWDDKDVPVQAVIKVDKDKEACEKDGKLLDDKLVVNPKNKGVRWCVVYLMNVKGFEKAIPIHPKLKALKQKEVTIDQPCCQFVPHVLAMREGQTLLVKNSATIAHNVNIIGGAKPPNLNQIVPPGAKLKVADIAARPIPITVKCDIHPWMYGRVAVLNHPYFAVTDENGNFEIKDAPAGEFRLVIYNDRWIIGDSTPSRNGKKITIEAGKTTDLGKFMMKPEKPD